MTQVQTARRTIDDADLGVTLMHEHVFVLSPEMMQNDPQVWGDEDKRMADAITRLGELRDFPGIRGPIDITGGLAVQCGTQRWAGGIREPAALIARWHG